MAAAASGDDIECDKLFRKLHELSGGDDEQAVIETTTKVLELKPDDEDAILMQLVALLRQSEHKQALSLWDKAPASIQEKAVLHRAYALYSLNSLNNCLKLLDSVEEKNKESQIGLMHLEAQVLYRLGQFPRAAQFYSSFGDTEDEEVKANACAAFVSAGQFDKAHAIADGASATQTYETVYNLACGLLEKGETEEALKELELASRLCEKSLREEEYTEEEIQNELAIIKTQQAYILQMKGQDDKALQMYNDVLAAKPSNSSVVAAASNNLLALRHDEKLFDSQKRMERALKVPAHKLSEVQRRAISFNNALLMLHSKKYQRGHELCAELMEKYPAEEFPVLVDAAIYYREKNVSKCVKTLRAYISTRPKNCVQSQLSLAAVYVREGKPKDAVAMLDRIESLAGQPAVVATQTAILENAGMLEESVELIQRTITAWDEKRKHDKLYEGLTRKLMEHGAQLQLKVRAVDDSKKSDKKETHSSTDSLAMYKKLLEQARASGDKKSQKRLLSSLVLASAEMGDAKACAEYSSQLPELKDASIDIDALEHAALPKQLVKKDKQEEEQDEKSEQKTQDIVKKKRKKKKTRYPKDFNPDKPGPMPDPERWLPRFERSAYKKGRGKRRQRMGGAQGAVMTQEEEEVYTKKQAERQAKTQDSGKQAKPGITSSQSSTKGRKGRGKRK